MSQNRLENMSKKVVLFPLLDTMEITGRKKIAEIPYFTGFEAKKA